MYKIKGTDTSFKKKDFLKQTEQVYNSMNEAVAS
jgi:hypothetical protein